MTDESSKGEVPVKWGEVRITREEVIVDHGVVAAGHTAEAAAGLRMLEEGGNAVDAAIAAAFAAGLVEPWNCGPGGHGFATVHHLGKTDVIDWVPPAPSRARPDMWELEEGYEGVFNWRRVKHRANEVGYLATAIPGTVAGLCLTHQRYGRLPLAKVLEPAILLGEQGFAVDWRTAQTLAGCQDTLRRFPGAAAIYLPGGTVPRAGNFYTPGDRIVQSDQAHLLRRIAEAGPDVVYRGEIAQAVVRDMATHHGLLTAEDLAGFKPLEYEGALSRYRGYEYSAMNTLLYIEALNILEEFDLAALGPDHPVYRHVMAEAMWQSFVDTFAHGSEPAQGLASKQYAAELADRIDLHKARVMVQPGDPWKYEGRPRTPRNGHSPDRPGGPAHHTTQVAVVDREGTMVSLITSLGTHFGSYVMIPGTGMFLSNCIESYDPEPGKAHSIAPGKHLARTVPTVVILRDGKPFAGLAGSGGWRITGGLLHVAVNLIDFGMGIQAAIDHPRLHCQDGNLYIDQRVSASVQSDLATMGHHVVPVEENVVQSNFCRAVGVLVDPVSGRLHGGADALRSAAVAGW